MTYIGNGTNLPFALRTVFDEYGVAEEWGTCNIWRAGAMVARRAADADMTIVDVPWPWDVDLQDDSQVIEVPAWVRQEISLADSWDGVIASLGKNVRDGQLRKIRKFGLTSVTTKEAAEADTFYDTMYVPHTRRRFGLAADIVSRDDVQACVTHGALLKILRGEEVIAACALNDTGEKLELCFIGFSEADLRKIDGASAAIYYFTLQYAFENGYRKVDYYGSRPVLNDGVFATKRRWGAAVYDDWSLEHLLFRLNSFSTGVRSFLRTNPLLTCHGDQLIARVLTDQVPLTAEEVKKTIRQFVSPGLGGLNVYATSGIERDAQDEAQNCSLPVRLFDLQDCDDPLKRYCR